MPAPKVCAQRGCPNLQPCPTPGHTAKPWQNSRRREKTTSGSKQQAAARRIMRRHRGICHVCSQPGADQVDHVIPLAEGGPDTDDNKRPIHSVPCHREKTAVESARARNNGT